MTSMLIYMVKVAIYLVAFYLIYSLLLKRDTTHARNRAFILLSLAASVILPFVTFNTSKPMDIQAFGELLSEVFVTSGSGAPDKVELRGPAGFIYSVYVTGVIIFILKLIIDFSSLFFLILSQRSTGSRIIRFQNFNTAGFTAMGYIFINTRLSPDEAGNVIRHERNHLKQNHYIDIILIEFLTAFQWFNPFIHLFNRELRAIHEYQADQDCISSGIPVASYQSLLISQVFRSGPIKLSNSFSSPSLLRQRMIMMTKKRTSQLANFKLLSIIPVAGMILLSISSNTFPPPPAPPSPTTTTVEEFPFVVVEEMPFFPGGDAALLKYLSEKVIYPAEAVNKNIQGRVIVRFCVTSKGGISQATVLKGVDPMLDAEAVRVVMTLPSFEPGRQDGKAVPVWYMVPITFTLK